MSKMGQKIGQKIGQKMGQKINNFFSSLLVAHPTQILWMAQIASSTSKNIHFQVSNETLKTAVDQLIQKMMADKTLWICF